ncbi:hypothetical protein EHP00_2120 [Ecytonucleospora hepatopenaei]|uniref:Uncharacterized protein n=1 Tax=Ecytonucleospora hepatopenaei TaxID=646526 RepID=A0A1W0E412_9MICR|nr:hypothetical protein EHP00_2120 [Ecytonucleospora hepatopenaei]
MQLSVHVLVTICFIFLYISEPAEMFPNTLRYENIPLLSIPIAKSFPFFGMNPAPNTPVIDRRLVNIGLLFVCLL